MSDDEDTPTSPAADDISFANLAVLGQNRKQVQLAERSAQLRRRNQLVSAKAEETKRQKQELETLMSAQMLMQMSRAGERRLRHLDLVREKARLLRHFLEERALEEYGTEALAVWPVEAQAPETNELTPQLKVIARAVRRFRLRRALKCRQCRLYFAKIVGFEISFKEAVILLRSPAISCVENLLRSLGLPDLGEDSYRWFLYSIVLISDFHESLNRNFDSLPGFNVNLREPLAVSVHLPILLYHLALRMFYTLRLFSDKDASPWCVRRLQFARNWRTYHFLFSIFRSNHKNASQQIANEAYAIGSTQHRILDAYGLLRSGDGIKENVALFKRHSRWLHSIKNYKELPWAQIGNTADAFCTDLEAIATNCLAVRDSSGNELFYDDLLTSDALLPVQEPQTIQFGPDAFTIPPTTSLNNWRVQWFAKFKGELTVLESLKAPLQIRAGFFNSDNKANMVTAMDVEAIFSEYHSQVHEGESRIETSVLQLEELFRLCLMLCKHIGKGSELRHAEVSFMELRRLFKFKPEVEAEKMVHNYIRLLLLLVLQLLEIAHISTIEADDLTSETSISLEELLDRLEMVTNDLTVAVLASWAISCAFPTSQEFVVFENVVQLLTRDAMRQSMGNDFPHVRFSPVYGFLYEYSSVLKQRFKPLLIVAAKEVGFVIDGSARDPVAKRFFKDAFVRFFFSNSKKPTTEKVKPLMECSLFLHFAKGLELLTSSATRLILALTLSTALCLSHGAATELYECLEGYDGVYGLQLPKTMTSFQASYVLAQLAKLEREEENVIDLFAERILLFMLELNATETLLRKNIRHHANGLLHLKSQIESFTDLFYEIYYPVLNWIHADLGLPK